MANSASVKVRVRDTEIYRWLQDPRNRFDMYVGIHAEDMNTTHDQGPLTVGEVAEISEFGVGNIPPRKWLTGWLPGAQANAVKQIAEALRTIIRSGRLDFSPLNQQVQWLKFGVRARLARGEIRPKNAPQTLANKKPETRPLIDTQQLLNTIQASIVGPRSNKHKTR